MLENVFFVRDAEGHFNIDYWTNRHNDNVKLKFVKLKSYQITEFAKKKYFPDVESRRLLLCDEIHLKKNRPENTQI